MGMDILPSTTVAATASRRPCRSCHFPADMKTYMTSRVGTFLSRMYSGKKSLVTPVESSQRPAEGAGFSRGRTECDEQMAPTDETEKKMVNRWDRRGGGHESGRPDGRSADGVQKTRPSLENWPGGKLARDSRAPAHGRPMRS